ncbi:MAG: hypothetical protein WDO71_03085 [Bacteroidota bacterium]
MMEKISEVFKTGVHDTEANFVTKAGKKIPYYFKAVLITYEGRPCLLEVELILQNANWLKKKHAG